MLIMLALFVTAGVCYSQAPVKRQKNQKTEQPRSSATKSKQQSKKLSDPDGYISDHGYVDLGLPSGLKWATCNIGASSPSDYGNYYAWGETTTKSSYADKNSLTYDKDESELRSSGIIGSSGNLTMSHDAARANWGGSWRMPTKKELEELKRKCTWTWTSQGGQYGYKVTGPNGKSIFLPAAGFYSDSSRYCTEERGYCWTASVYAGSESAYELNIGRGEHSVARNWRSLGRSVRAVSE